MFYEVLVIQVSRFGEVLIRTLYNGRLMGDPCRLPHSLLYLSPHSESSLLINYQLAIAYLAFANIVGNEIEPGFKGN